MNSSYSIAFIILIHYINRKIHFREAHKANNSGPLKKLFATKIAAQSPTGNRKRNQKRKETEKKNKYILRERGGNRKENKYMYIYIYRERERETETGTEKKNKYI